MDDARRAEISRADEPVLDLVGFRIEHWRFVVRLSQVKTSVMPTEVTRVRSPTWPLRTTGPSWPG